MAKILFWSLLFFLTDLVLAVVTCLLAYLTQMLTTERCGGTIPPVFAGPRAQSAQYF